MCTQRTRPSITARGATTSQLCTCGPLPATETWDIEKWSTHGTWRQRIWWMDWYAGREGRLTGAMPYTECEGGPLYHVQGTAAARPMHRSPASVRNAHSFFCKLLLTCTGGLQLTHTAAPARRTRPLQHPCPEPEGGGGAWQPCRIW